VQTTKLPPKSDFVFLADNTSSMTPSIDDVKANAQTVIDAIEASGATDARYGVGNYEDFTQGGPCLHGFELDTDLTDATAAKAAINTWIAEAGCDIAEANFFGLHRVAVHDISGGPTLHGSSSGSATRRVTTRSARRCRRTATRTRRSPRHR
jgi:hypothetical protein